MSTKSFLTQSSVESAEYIGRVERARQKIDLALAKVRQEDRERHADFWRRGYAVGHTEGHDEGMREKLPTARKALAAATEGLRREWILNLACFVLGASVVAIMFGVLQLL